MAGSSIFKSGPKGSEMVNQDVFDHLGPFWARLDPFRPFQTTNYFLLKPYFILMGQQIDFCLKWSKRVPNCQRHLGLPFRTLLDPFGTLWNVCFIGAFFGTPCT